MHFRGEVSLFSTFIYVVPETQKEQVFEGCHSCKLGGGHFGRDFRKAVSGTGMVNQCLMFGSPKLKWCMDIYTA